MQYFRFKDTEYDRQYSGLSQFVLLVTLYPFILDFSLYDFSEFIPDSTFRIFFVNLDNTIDYLTFWKVESARNAAAAGSSSKVGGYLAAAVLVLVIVCYFIAFVRNLIKRRFGWLIVGLGLANMCFVMLMWSVCRLFDLGNNTSCPVPESWALDEDEIYLIAIVLSKLMFLWFALRGRVFSRSFAAFVGLVFLVIAANHPTDFDLSFVFQFLVQIFCLMAAVAFVRLVVMAVWDNLYFLREMGFVRSTKTLARTLVLWSPMLLLAIPYFTAVHLAREAVVEKLYNPPHKYGDPEPFRLRPYLGRPPDVRRDMLLKLAQNIRNQKRSFDRVINGYRLELVKLQREGFTRIVLHEFDSVFQEKIKFTKPDYHGFIVGGVKNFAVNSSHDVFNAGWGEIRRKMRERVEARARSFDRTFTSLTAGTIHQLDNFRNFADKVFINGNTSLQFAIWWTFTYLSALEMLVHLVFALVCLKSFMYVYSRVAFGRQDGSFLTLGITGEPAVQPIANIRSTGNEYFIPQGTEGVFYFSRHFQAQGKAPRFAIPQPFKTPIARLLHGAVSMNEVDMKPGDDAVRYSLTGGSEFMEWTLKEGEEIVFDFRNFVGMSQSIRLSTLISARLSSLILGKFIFSQATGPGIMVFRSDGRTEVAGQGERSSSSTPPERLLAMHKNTRFHVDSNLGVFDVYLSTAYVKLAGSGVVIIDVDTQKGGQLGLMRFIKHFLWPG